MKEQDLLDSTSPGSFPSFNEVRHNILCSELKQLYVAITRTRQRLWIWENKEEFSKPMFDYWKKRFLVQVRRLDDSLAQAMQVASSPEEWKSRGIKVCEIFKKFIIFVCLWVCEDISWSNFLMYYALALPQILILLLSHSYLDCMHTWHRAKHGDRLPSPLLYNYCYLLSFSM